ncbi:hypothetical protein ABFA07_013551 [Porites harrisoni]
MFDLESVKVFTRNLRRRIAPYPKELWLAFGVTIVFLACFLIYSLAFYNPGQKSSELKVEEDNRILATGFDCRQKPLCDANAICTTDPLNKDRHVCVCNNGFQGNGSSCHGQRKISAFLNFRFCRATFRLGIGFSST